MKISFSTKLIVFLFAMMICLLAGGIVGWFAGLQSGHASAARDINTLAEIEKSISKTPLAQRWSYENLDPLMARHPLAYKGPKGQNLVVYAAPEGSWIYVLQQSGDAIILRKIPDGDSLSP